MVISDQHRKAGLGKRKLFFQRLRPFNDPETKDFSCIDEIILISVFFIDSGSLSSWISGNDPVYQGRTENVFFFDPVDEIFSQIPLVCIFQHTFFQLFSVVIDQLAGQDDKSFSFLVSECLETAVEELGQFGRIAGRGCFLKSAGRIIGDTCLGGITGNETEFRIFCAFHYFFIVAVYIQATADAGDDPFVIDFLTVFKTSQI